MSSGRLPWPNNPYVAECGKPWLDSLKLEHYQGREVCLIGFDYIEYGRLGSTYCVHL
jgi:hypothetical protein